ncbi:cupin domain-containing protein [Photobacterium chitinilyticum]|uniref:Cupin domain-containing protein n=1 Tax=Photobacterium chitinilyticum TaxID=2485123 RepID=A0A444JNS9_9GAMM|nr:cupin domain-containing protein [Photobacterium chitinilyticum]RWX54717.1 cupin domain-containing protein [Photobacterium chitinilyticum]
MNVFENIPAELPGEIFEDIVNTSTIRIERIISKGHTTPTDEWYDQDEHEWVVVLKGEARIRFDDNDRELHLKQGDHLNILAHQRHQVSWTIPDQETIWLAVFYR